MQWSTELVVMGSLSVIFVLGFLVLSGKKETVFGKLFTFSVVGFVLSLLVYAVSLNQFNDGMAAFKMAFDWFQTGVRIAQAFLAPLVV